MTVTLEEAYAEACRVIGEQIVQSRLLARIPEPDTTTNDISTDQRG